MATCSLFETKNKSDARDTLHTVNTEYERKRTVKNKHRNLHLQKESCLLSMCVCVCVVYGREIRRRVHVHVVQSIKIIQNYLCIQQFSVFGIRVYPTSIYEYEIQKKNLSLAYAFRSAQLMFSHIVIPVRIYQISLGSRYLSHAYPYTLTHAHP